MAKPLDENDLHKLGKLSDPREDSELVSRPGDELDKLAPTFADAYGLKALEADKQSALIRIATLPEWFKDTIPEGAINQTFGSGLGALLETTLGGGLRPGDTLGIGAGSAGFGKTGLVMQLVEGLAARNPEIERGEERWGKTLTPVVIASEMDAAALTWRSLARWCGVNSQVFRRGLHDGMTNEDRSAWDYAEEVLGPNGKLTTIRRWERFVSPSGIDESLQTGPEAFVNHLERIVEMTRNQIQQTEAGRNREIVPVVVIDPLQRFQGPGDAIENLERLARSLDQATKRGRWISIISSDTNKSSATGDNSDKEPEEFGAAVFRGTYGLMHVLEAAIAIRRPPKCPAPTVYDKVRVVEAIPVKARWGSSGAARFWFDAPRLRFWPMNADDVKKQLEAEKKQGGTNSSTSRSGNATKMPGVAP